jgi:hypothetical protein
LSRELDQEKAIEVIYKEREDALQEFDVSKRVTDSSKRERRDLEQRLEMIKDEFALISTPTEYLYAP